MVVGVVGGARERNVVLAFACQAHNCKLYVVLVLPLAPRTGTKQEQVNIFQCKSISLLKSLFLYMRSK